MPVCPKCGQQDVVRPVGEIVSSKNLYSGSVLRGDEEPGSPTAKELAQRLFISDEMWAEIEKKDRDEVSGGSGRLNRSLGIFFCALGGFLLVNQFDPQWAWLGLILGMLLGEVFFNYLPSQVIKKGWATARQAREKAQQRYAALYYCQRDDLVFLPDEALSAPADEMIELLYHE